MFTGIVEEVGTVAERKDSAESTVFTFRGPVVSDDARFGQSIAVNGVCLTVTSCTDESFTADVMAETLNRSALGTLTPGQEVNLERAALVNSRLDGHIVQGHVDGTGAIVSRTPGDNWELVRISLPVKLAKYVVEKGSITVSGISLTVSAVSDALQDEIPTETDSASWFEVSLIPTTMAETTLGTAVSGDLVNLEVDIVAKYVERLTQFSSGGTN